MSTRSTALNWFSSKYGKTANKIYTSKYYTHEESYSKTHVWWLKIPLEAIDVNKFDFVNILCATAPNSSEFHYLKVPTKFLNEHLKKFARINDIITLYLSANPKTLFVEERGEGSLPFAQFLVT